MTKQLDQLEAKLGGTLLDNLSAEASTASVRISFFDSDNPTVKRTPDSGTLKFTLDPENTQGKPSEFIRCVSHSTSSNGITTLVTVTRGLQRDATVDLTGSASRAQAWDASTTPVGVSTEPHNMNLVKKYFAGTEQIPGDIDIAGTLEVDGITKLNDKIELTGTATYIDKVGTDMVFKDASNVLTTLSDLTAAAGTDTKARVSANDTTSGFLNGKLVAGNGVSLTENNDGGDETLTIAFSINSTYGIDASGNDTYAVALSPALSAYTDGQVLSFEAGTANTGSATVNFNSLGAIPIKKGNYFDVITGDVTEDRKILGQVSVKTVTFTGALLIAAVSGTLTGNWGYKTGTYSVLFSNGDRRDVTLTKGATTATWSGGLSAAATANAVAQWFDMQNPSSSLEGGSNATENHYHDLLRNNSLARRNMFRSDTGSFYSKTIDGTSSFGVSLMATAAANNDWSGRCIIFTDKTGKLNSNALSVHNKNPSFRVTGSFDSNTVQDGFIGLISMVSGANAWANAGTSLENAAMTVPHIGFVVQDGTLSISVADGTTQSKTDISATVPSVTAGHIFEAYFDGTTATFYVDNVLINTLATNVPTANLDGFFCVVIADASNTSRNLRIQDTGWVCHDEV